MGEEAGKAHLSKEGKSESPSEVELYWELSGGKEEWRLVSGHAGWDGPDGGGGSGCVESCGGGGGEERMRERSIKKRGYSGSLSELALVVKPSLNYRPGRRQRILLNECNRPIDHS